LSAVDTGVGSKQWRAEVLWLTQIIIENDPTKHYVYRGDPKKKQLIPEHKSLFVGEAGAGLLIGNLTSQFFGNAYLHELDMFITKKLQQEKYLRYVDDFVIVSFDKQSLLESVAPINYFLNQSLCLQLHPKKTMCQVAARGVDFLGYIVRPNYVLVRQSVVKRLRQKQREWSADGLSSEDVKLRKSNVKSSQLTDVTNSYVGHFSHANSYRLGQRVCQRSA
jgi:hypothetical protein